MTTQTRRFGAVIWRNDNHVKNQMKEHLKFALKVLIAMAIINAVLGLLGGAGAQIKAIVANPLGSFNLFGGGGSAAS